MVLTYELETGTGSPTATSLVDPAFVDDYVATFYPANTTWAALATLADKQQATIRGSQALSILFCGKWKGRQTQFEQAQDWPRYPVHDMNGFLLDSTSVPGDVHRAVAELSILDADGFTVVAQSAGSGGSVLQKTTKKMGPFVTTTEYAAGSGPVEAGIVTDRVVPKLRFILCDLLLAGGASGFAERGG